MNVQLNGAEIDLEAADWDTEVTGLKCARVSSIRLGQGQSGKTLAQSGFEYVIVRWPAEDEKTIKCLESNGFFRLDSIVNFEGECARISSSAPSGEAIIRKATADDERAAATLSGRSFNLSRFHVDPVLGEKISRRVHEEWMRNSIRGVAADAVFLAEKRGELAGFITCKKSKETGAIELVAVDAKFSGQGLGAALVSSAVRWMSDQGCTRASVRTQTNNEPAVQLYVKMGFLEKNQTITYRWTCR